MFVCVYFTIEQIFYIHDYNVFYKIQSHPTAKGLFKKPFPHYNALVDIYAKDYANGIESNFVEDAQAQVTDEQAQAMAGVEFGSTLGAEFGLDDTSFEDMIFGDMNSTNGVGNGTQYDYEVPSNQTEVPLNSITTTPTAPTPTSTTPTTSKTTTLTRKQSSSHELSLIVSDIASAIMSLFP